VPVRLEVEFGLTLCRMLRLWNELLVVGAYELGCLRAKHVLPMTRFFLFANVGAN
jgi:hypothetical protein